MEREVNQIQYKVCLKSPSPRVLMSIIRAARDLYNSHILLKICPLVLSVDLCIYVFKSDSIVGLVACNYSQQCVS